MISKQAPGGRAAERTCRTGRQSALSTAASRDAAQPQNAKTLDSALVFLAVAAQRTIVF